MKRFAVFTIALLFTFSFGESAHASDIEMPALMRLFAISKHIKAEFVERKFLQILDTPVESNGELVFRAPSRLEKKTRLPKSETLIIDGSSVSIERGSFKRTLPLDEFADMASMVRSLTATFRGDQVSIEQFFKWKLSGPAEKWQLVLTPKSSKLFITLKEIRLSGDNGYVHTVETTLTDGDRSLMTLGRPVVLPIP
jgi:outer membrane lipoprotein-sorting protein